MKRFIKHFFYHQVCHTSHSCWENQEQIYSKLTHLLMKCCYCVNKSTSLHNYELIFEMIFSHQVKIEGISFRSICNTSPVCIKIKVLLAPILFFFFYTFPLLPVIEGPAYERGEFSKQDFLSSSFLRSISKTWPIIQLCFY